MTWTGWYRLSASAPWQKACEGETLDGCARLLTEATRRLKLKNTDYIMTGGAVPPSPGRAHRRKGRR